MRCKGSDVLLDAKNHDRTSRRKVKSVLAGATGTHAHELMECTSEQIKAPDGRRENYRGNDKDVEEDK